MEVPMMLAGGAAIGIIAGFWRYIKHFVSKIFSLFVVTVKIEGEMPDAVISYCSEKLRRLPMGGKTFGSYFEYVKPNRRTERIGYEELSKRSSIFLKGWRPVLVGPPIKGNDNDAYGAINITYIRGTFNIDELIIRAIRFANEKTKTGVKERFRIRRLAGSGSIIKRRHGGGDQGYPVATADKSEANSDSFVLGNRRLLKWGIQEIGQEVFSDESAFEILAFPPEVEEFVDEAKKWKQSEKWYKEKQIQWRRGWLLYGPPGTGKTSLVRAVAYDLDLPIYSFDLSTMSNEELVEKWKLMKTHTPCVALMEDIDAVFEGRNNKLGEYGGGLTFDCLLNCIGGIENCDGVMLIVTTNKIEDVDEAIGVPRKDKAVNGTKISTRPGRIDRALELKELTEKCRVKIAGRILKDYPEHIAEIAKNGAGDTGAQFQERCTQIALEKYWIQKNADREREKNSLMPKYTRK